MKKLSSINVVSAEAIKGLAALDPLGSYRRAGYPHDLRPHGRNLTGLCPFHPDKTPSFVVTRQGEYAGRWHCFGSCREGGDIIDFYMRLHAALFPEALRQLDDLLGARAPLPSSPTISPSPPDTTEPTPTPLPESIAVGYHDALLASPDALKFLTERKGLPLWIIKDARIGLSSDRWRGTRFTIPIPCNDGSDGYHDIRGYRPDAGREVPKMLPWSSGRGTVLYPWPWVQGERKLLWVEGELDCLNLLARGIPAVTATNGVDGALTVKLPDLTGIEVRILGDHDDAGKRLARELPDRLRRAGASAVYRLFWPECLPDGTPTAKGFDVSDLVSRGLTVEEVWQYLCIA